MKVIEILNFNRELLKKLHAAGIRMDDARYIDLYADYTRLLDRGEKVSYTVAVLSEKYSVSERKVYNLVKRFKSECNSLIFGGVNISIRILNAAAWAGNALHAACSPMMSSGFGTEASGHYICAE